MEYNQKFFLKLAKNKEEIEKAQKLRTRKFKLKKFDSDEFDELCDHLLLYKEKDLIGTMRLRQSKSYNYPLYSSQEFELNGFEKKILNHNLIEAGRFCVKEGYSPFSPLMLLIGEFEYAKSRNIENFLGCTSFHTESQKDAEEIFLFLEKRGDTVERSKLIKTKEKYRIPFCPQEDLKKEIKIEPLPELYFNFGAKIISEPALDKEFHCIDYLMAGNVKKIPEKFVKMFSYAKKNLEMDSLIFKKTLFPIWKKKKKFFFLERINPQLKINEKKFQRRYGLHA